MSFRLLVMAGHGKNMDGSWDPGAVGCGYQEANLTRELRDLIKLRDRLLQVLRAVVDQPS